MKRVLFSAAILISTIVPVAHAEPLATKTTQSVCVPVIVDTPEGPVEGVLCFPQGGHV